MCTALYVCSHFGDSIATALYGHWHCNLAPPAASLGITCYLSESQSPTAGQAGQSRPGHSPLTQHYGQRGQLTATAANNTTTTTRKNHALTLPTYLTVDKKINAIFSNKIECRDRANDDTLIGNYDGSWCS